MLLEGILLLAACFLFFKLFILAEKPHGTPPGTTGLPIIGSLPGRNVTFESFINSHRQKYGDIFWLKMGSDNHVILCNYEYIAAAFNNPDLQGRPFFLSAEMFYKYGQTAVQRRQNPMVDTSGLLFSSGDRWKNLRRFVIRRLRDGGMGKSSMESIILREAEALTEEFEKYVGKPTVVPWSVNASILNAVWGIVGDQRYEIYEKEIQQLCNYLNDVLDISQNRFFLFDNMAWLAKITPNFILNYFGKNEFEEKMEQVYKPLHEAVAAHKKTLDVDNPRDLIDSYLIDLKDQENDSPNKSDYAQSFCERELIQTLFDLFIAGSETTSSTFRWFMFFMAKYPEIQKKVQEELDRVVPKDRMISLTDKDSLPYFECCINETLRLKSILPFGLIHLATENTKIAGYFVPKGTQVIASLICCHREPKYWEKPNDYYPEHFLNRDGTFNSKKQGFVPFSTGRRVCLGENLAKMDLFLILGTILRKFTISASDNENMSYEPTADQSFFSIPNAFKVIINKRD